VAVVAVEQCAVRDHHVAADVDACADDELDAMADVRVIADRQVLAHRDRAGADPHLLARHADAFTERDLDVAEDLRHVLVEQQAATHRLAGQLEQRFVVQLALDPHPRTLEEAPQPEQQVMHAGDHRHAETRRAFQRRVDAPRQRGLPAPNETAQRHQRLPVPEW
jgi:hypothetical protein